MWKKWLNTGIAATLLFGMLPYGKSFAALEGNAGTSTEAPAFTYENGTTGKDVNAGDKYYYVQNDEAIAVISNKVGNNNAQGSFKKGWPVDFVSKDPKANMKETLDWAELVLSPTMNNKYAQTGLQLDLSNISVDGDSIVASGQWDSNAKIKSAVKYELLPDAPVMKMTLTLNNTDTKDFAGYFLYSLDPDVPGAQVSYAPGIGWYPGLRTSGWSENYIYDGTDTSSGEPAHAIAWLDNQPTGIHGNDIYFGAWFDASVKAGESRQISWYHITEIPSERGNAYDNFSAYAKELSVLDPAVPDYSKVSGTMTDTTTGNGIKGVTLVAKNINAQVAGTVTTDSAGKYELYLPANTYTLTASRPGYEAKSSSVEITSDSTIQYPMDYAMKPISVSAGTGVHLLGSMSEGSMDDIVLQNSKVAMAIAKTTVDSQLKNSVGRPLDFTVQGMEDDLDWINLPYLRKGAMPTTNPWDVETVTSTSVDVGSVTPDEASVKVKGTYSEVPGIEVETTYSVKAGKQWIDAETVFKNTTDTDLTAFAGDALDHDGPGTISYVPGVGQLPTLDTYTPSSPWFAQYGTSGQEYGIIYDSSFSGFTVFGNNTYVISEKQITVPAGGEFRMLRHLVAVGTEGLVDKSTAMNNVYDDLISEQTGIRMDLATDKNNLETGDTFKATLTVTNESEQSVSGLAVNLKLPANLTTTDVLAQPIPDIPAHGAQSVSWNLSASSGGHGNLEVDIDKDGAAYTVKTEQVFVNGPGWYAGDNHTHSRYSDGSGSINDNATVARNKGLDFLTATDHNSIKQKDDVLKENRPDFVELLGEEVTTGTGHSLAYDISSLINWAQPAQSYIDETRANNDGQGMHFIAHPYYPGLEWEDWSVKNYNGIEVWNGFYPPKHTVNAQAFAKWDELNKQGRHIIGLANSDAHNPGKVGDPHIKAYMDKLSKEDVYKAIRSGMLYGTNGDIDLAITVNGKPIGSDVTVDPAGGEATITLSGSAPGGLTTARLIKNGTVVQEFKSLTGTSWTQTVQDNAVPGDFYRMELEGTGGKFAFSNPIWVTDGVNVPQSMSFEQPNPKLLESQTAVLGVTGTYIDKSTRALSATGKLAFTSSDASTVAVDNSGNLIAVKPGQAVVTVSFGNLQILTTVTVEANQAPVGQAGSYTTTVGHPVDGVLAAADANGDQLTYQIATQGTKGVATVTNPATGAFTYVTNEGAQPGTDSFTFTASDGKLTSAETTVTITINEEAPTNTAPVAADGSFETNQDVALTDAALSAADADEGDTLTYTIVTNGEKGSAVIADPATGSFTYTPQAGVSGTDHFTFKVNDGHMDSNTATVTITIKPGNHLPVADNISVNTTTGVAIDVTLKGTDADGDPLTYAIVDNGTKGNAVIADPAVGKAVYTPSADVQTESTDTFTYQVSDGKGTSTTATVTVSIKPPGPGHPSEPTSPTTPQQPSKPEEPAKPPVEPPVTSDPAPSKPVDQIFGDVKESWAKGFIQQAVDSGLINGFPDGSFKPNQAITRVEFLAVLVRAMGYGDAGAELPFKDLANAPGWMTDTVGKAIKAGVVTGYNDNTFRPNQPLSRAEMIALLARAMGLVADGTTSTFADASSIPTWARSLAEQLKQQGIIEGRGDGNFVPDAISTRAEAVKVIMSALQVIK
ncbi:CehA/McbA family metallohydrolase [Paenibacillus sp. BC26]|uniref:CehA/McbA family metallohydrolase n=1 Tax=Paenibacillus sp. BC26 TaxID=1881032 RepID=UPI0008E2D3D9|nr:CehA/McbA family metallohydrolase [Paenibacillus sp. BC26]SFT04841.1 Histidinol phosphatase [Paenibacillus sp. BC26]